MRNMLIEAIVKEVIEEMCDNYCKYPEQLPEGKDEDWLRNDPESPCADCPLSRLC